MRGWHRYVLVLSIHDPHDSTVTNKGEMTVLRPVEGEEALLREDRGCWVGISPFPWFDRPRVDYF